MVIMRLNKKQNRIQVRSEKRNIQLRHLERNIHVKHTGQRGLQGKEGTRWFTEGEYPSNADVPNPQFGDLYLHSDGQYDYYDSGNWYSAGTIRGNDGQNGNDGLPGERGMYGGNAVMFSFDPDITSEGTLPGYVRFNRRYETGPYYRDVVEIRISYVEHGGLNVKDWVLSIGQADNPAKGYLRIYDRQNVYNYTVFRVLDVTDHDDYASISVESVFTNAVFDNVNELVVDFSQNGDSSVGGSAGGDDKNYVTDFTVTDIVEVSHGLNKYCSVSVIDSAGEEVIGEVDYIDTNNLTVRFNYPFSGKITCN